MKSKKGKNLSILPVAGSIFVLLLILFVIYSFKGIVRVHKLMGEEHKLMQKISSIKKRNRAIGVQIYKLSNNKQYIASLAREKLYMIKKGEIVFRFIHKKKDFKKK